MAVPRAPKAPRTPRLKVPGPLRLAPARSTESLKLDERSTVPYVKWDEFRRRVKFRQGEHITVVGTTGSGKTVLIRELVENRNYCAVLGTKNEDRELYGPFEDKGFTITGRFDPSKETDEKKIIFRPRLSAPDAAGRRKQSEAFRSMLNEVWQYGGWTVVADELFYVCQTLGLADVFETLWSTGRSLNVTIVGATQLPVKVPLMAFDQATHLFLFRNTDRRRINRMAEFAGADERLMRGLIPELPKHEFCYVDTRTGTILRSKVTL